MKEIIWPHVLKNAAAFGGKANIKVVLGFVLRAHPELKKDVGAVLKTISELSGDVEKMSLEEIKAELKKQGAHLEKDGKKEEASGKRKSATVKGPLKALKNAEVGKVKVRMAPSPSGPLHIGHAYGALINALYAEMYKGSLLLRIEDTNAENIYPPAYELIEEDTRWLVGDILKEVVVQSSRLDRYYLHAKKLVEIAKAYVCTCDNDEWRSLKAKGKACPCRELEAKEQLERYEKLFDGYAEGEAVLRLKTDIAHKNPAMRDFGIMRIVEKKHPKTGSKNRVWPLMVFSVAIDDHELGVTHVLNGKDHEDNGRKEALIMSYLGWKAPEYQHWGRINFEGFKLSTSKTRLAIEQGEYDGWDDIRLATLGALRRRGYAVEAFRRFAMEIGLSKNDKTVSWKEFWKMVNAFDREVNEEKANRYFFVADPVEIVMQGFSGKEVALDLHPDFPDRGSRKLLAREGFYLAREDFDKLEEGKVHRLIDCLNFVIEGGVARFVSESYEDYSRAGKEKKGKIIHWLAIGESKVDVELMLEDHGILKGFGEKGLADLKEGDIVQLQRVAFARIDKVEKGKVKVWYLHK